jgi:hypothetical protein
MENGEKSAGVKKKNIGGMMIFGFNDVFIKGV